MTAENEFKDDGEVNHVRCKMLFFLLLNLVNFKALIVNLIHERCDTLSHDEMFTVCH